MNITPTKVLTTTVTKVLTLTTKLYQPSYYKLYQLLPSLLTLITFLVNTIA